MYPCSGNCSRFCGFLSSLWFSSSSVFVLAFSPPVFEQNENDWEVLSFWGKELREFGGTVTVCLLLNFASHHLHILLLLVPLSSKWKT